MQLLSLFLEVLKQLFVPLGAYTFGKKTKENEQLKEENAKLKEYDSIENSEHSVNDIYDAGMWNKK